MICSPKTFNLVLAAMLVVSGVIAAGAQAGEYTGEENGKNVKTIMDGTARGNQVFATPKAKITCTAFSASDEFATGKSLTLTTQEPVYSDCTHTVATDTTITMNGCHYKFTEPKNDGKGNYAIAGDFTCPKTKRVEIHIYTTKFHTVSVCTMTMYPKNPGEEEGEVIEEEMEGEIAGKNEEEESEGGGKSFALNVGVTNLNFEEHGAGCPDGNGSKVVGSFNGEVLWRATNDKGQPIDAKLSG